MKENENTSREHNSVDDGQDRLYGKAVMEHRPYILESFYYADADTERLLPYYGDFLLDSGAFTFMSAKKTVKDMDEYIERYADFIRRNKVEKYFEMDIDSLVGYEKVLEYRHRLERLTGRQCIPVWHPSRGIVEYKKMADEYQYIALGGIVSKEWKKGSEKIFPHLIEEAHRRGSRIHGLGFTNLAQLPFCHFDSVDSTAWTTGNRFGFLYYFNGKTMVKRDAPPGHRIRESRGAALNNYMEWIKFQRWADGHL